MDFPYWGWNPRGAAEEYAVGNRAKIIVLVPADPTGPGCCSLLLAMLSLLVVLVSLPISLCLCIKVVQEYERAVIFRLGRLRGGGAKGPGIFFVIPCITSYKRVDLRTVSFDVPPQEVISNLTYTQLLFYFSGAVQGLCNCCSGCCHLLQGV